MRRRSVWLATLVLLVTLLPASAQDRPALTCGPDASDGVLLYRAYIEDGSLADPPLALAVLPDQTTMPVPVEDPREITPVPSLCSALVRSSSGAYSIVDGSSGDVKPLDLDDPGDLALHMGAGQWAIFTPGGLWDFHPGRLVNLRTGEEAPLIPEDARVAAWDVRLSPSGNYLIVGSHPSSLIMPTGDWSGVREVTGGENTYVRAFDASEQHLLVAITRSDGTEALIVEEVASGTGIPIVEAPDSDGSSSLGGWFVPERDAVLVSDSDGLTLVDFSTGQPEQSVSIPADSDWLAAALAPEGALILTHDEPGAASTDPALPPSLAYVDFEQGELTRLTGPDGEPVQIVTTGERWALLTDGDAGGLSALDLETGQMSTVLEGSGNETVLPELARSSEDGSMAFVVLAVAGEQERGYLIDARTSDVAELVEGDRVKGAVSPAGDWIAYTTHARSDDGQRMALSVVEVATGSVTPLGPGLDPIWLNG